MQSAVKGQSAGARARLLLLDVSLCVQLGSPAMQPKPVGQNPAHMHMLSRASAHVAASAVDKP